MIILDYQDSRPLYEQITEKFGQLILHQVLDANSRMPSVRSLAMELSINPNTIQKAYDKLEREGFIYSVKGRGCYVSEVTTLMSKHRDSLILQFTTLVKESYRVGITCEEMTAIVKKEGDHL